MTAILQLRTYPFSLALLLVAFKALLSLVIAMWFSPRIVHSYSAKQLTFNFSHLIAELVHYFATSWPANLEILSLFELLLASLFLKILPFCVQVCLALAITMNQLKGQIIKLINYFYENKTIKEMNYLYFSRKTKHMVSSIYLNFSWSSW